MLQPLTQFPPLSSTPHIILLHHISLNSTNFLPSQSPFTFKLLIHLPSLFPTASLFTQRFLQILHIPQHKPQPSTSPHTPSKPPPLNLIHLLLRILPPPILPFLFHHLIQKYLFTLPTLLIPLFIRAIYMIIPH
ncbi:undecaprenyl-diphosphate phosphatase, partial [Staphylococcus epidermidis]|uniref:undecaprenyl-diphosphate phosphatase n=1 Tax=Staphylococcus epidermidis TaxID=1282 RepID=UPI0037DA565F